MPPERRRLTILLGMLGAVVLVALWRFWPSAAPAAGPRPATAAGARAGSAASVTAPDVHLEALDDQRPEPEGAPGRNLFRFAPKAPPPRPASSSPATTSAAPNGPPQPPPLPPIAMRFIGLVEAPQHAQKIAILSDGRGTYQGREGDIIEGRYRILRIGVESIDMAYLDGQGRQTIRLSGS
jgi:hypothetical protein